MATNSGQILSLRRVKQERHLDENDVCGFWIYINIWLLITGIICNIFVCQMIGNIKDQVGVWLGLADLRWACHLVTVSLVILTLMSIYQLYDRPDWEYNMNQTVYLITVSLVCIALFGAGLWIAVKAQKVEEVYYKSLLAEQIHYDWSDSSNSTTSGWDYIQRQLRCCGNKSPEKEWSNIRPQVLPDHTLPGSCCDTCNMITNTTLCVCNSDAADYHADSCGSIVKSFVWWLNATSGAIAGLSGVCWGILCLLVVIIERLEANDSGPVLYTAELQRG